MLNIKVRTVKIAKMFQNSASADSCFLCISRSGKAILNFEGNSVIFTEGTIVLLPPEQLFTVESYSPSSDFVCIQTDRILLQHNGFPLECHGWCLSKEDQVRMFQMTDGMYQEQTDRTIGYKAAMLGNFSALLCLILRCGHKITGQQQKLAAAIQFMQENYSRDITLHDLAGLTGISVSHFRRIFQEEFAISPIDYLLKLRLQKAQELLIDPEVSISRIAVMTGFNDANYFSRLFTNRLGQSPRSWRQSFLKK